MMGGRRGWEESVCASQTVDTPRTVYKHLAIAWDKAYTIFDRQSIYKYASNNLCAWWFSFPVCQRLTNWCIHYVFVVEHNQPLTNTGVESVLKGRLLFVFIVMIDVW
jgi:hypothetical protein